MGKSKARKQQEYYEDLASDLREEYGTLKQEYADMSWENPFLNQTNFMAGLENTYSGMENVYAGMDNVYAGMDNVYSGLENKMAGLENVYSGLENTMEDLTVNQQQAEFERQQFQQSQADILGGLRGAAGGSGIAGLAQTLAREGQIASQRAGASIGQQESVNRRLAAQEAGKLQMAEAGYAGSLQQMQAQEASRLQSAEAGYAGQLDMAQAGYAGQLAMAEAGYAGQLDMAEAGQAYNLQMAEAQMAQDIQSSEIQGEMYVDAMELQQMENILGMTQAELAGYQDASMNWQGQTGKGWDIMGQFFQGFGEGLGGSDRKLKKNIKLIGYSPSGLKIYAFEYIDKAFGSGVHQGVMSDEIPQSAVVRHKDGYDMVDYSKIDVEFKKII